MTLRPLSLRLVQAATCALALLVCGCARGQPAQAPAPSAPAQPVVAIAPAPPPPPVEPQLSGQGDHACLLRAGGEVICWGLDLQNVALDAPSGEPAVVKGLENATAIAVGVAHGCALRRDGHVLCWGFNGNGQLGTLADKKSWTGNAVEIPGLTDAVALGSASTLTCAVHATGEVSCWGSWDAYVAGPPFPVKVPNLHDAVALAFGEAHACALQKSGHVSCWGDDLHGQVGAGPLSHRSFDVTTPREVAGLDDAIDLSAARLDTCAVKKTGAILCWGKRATELAKPAKGPPTPVLIPGAKDATRVFVGDAFGCALRKTGALACWWPLPRPWDQAQARKLHRSKPGFDEVKIPALKGVRQLLSAGATYALLPGGKVLAFGDHARRIPGAEVEGLADAIALGSGEAQSCALRASGQIACWGATGSGMASSGVGAAAGSRFQPTPVNVKGVSGASQLAVGAWHACALLKKKGTVVCWGENQAGQLGSGKKSAGLSAAQRKKLAVVGPVPSELQPRSGPSKVAGLSKVIDLSAGGDTSCAVLEGGKVMCWGAGEEGQLGNGATVSSAKPVEVAGITDAQRVFVGEHAACVLRATGEVSCWGRWSKDVEKTPVAVPGLEKVAELSLGADAACAVLADGTARCLGSGFLGNGSRKASPTAVAVSGVSDASAIAIGRDQRCVLHTGGAVSCWGRNFRGTLGDGTRVDRSAPVPVLALAGVKQLSAGTGQTCALLEGGTIRCWGDTATGGLGDGRDPAAPTELVLMPKTEAPKVSPVVAK